MSRTMTISSWSAANVTVEVLGRILVDARRTARRTSAATRRGSRPARRGRGSSPMAASTSMMAFSTRSVSTLMAGLSALGRFGIGVDGRQVAQALVHVEAVAHHEVGGDVEPDIAEIDRRSLLTVLDQERTDLEAGRVAGHEVSLEIVEGQAAVHDVLHHQHVPVDQVDIEVLDDTDHAARSWWRSHTRTRP